MVGKKNNKHLRKRIARVNWINVVKEVEQRTIVYRVDSYIM